MSLDSHDPYFQADIESEGDDDDRNRPMRRGTGIGGGRLGTRGSTGVGGSSGSFEDTNVEYEQIMDNGLRGPLRKGKWTMEEEQYANKIINYFNKGLLGIPNGTTLRSYLSEKLNWYASFKPSECISSRIDACVCIYQICTELFTIRSIYPYCVHSYLCHAISKSISTHVTLATRCELPRNSLVLVVLENKYISPVRSLQLPPPLLRELKRSWRGCNWYFWNDYGTNLEGAALPPLGHLIWTILRQVCCIPFFYFLFYYLKIRTNEWKNE